ncbi:MAG: hypothetical protein WEB52_02100 [Dehalococcoidia bacterium]
MAWDRGRRRGAGAFAWQQGRRQRTERLQSTFGNEYDRTVERSGDRRQAESELEERRARVERLQLHEIPPEQRQRLQTAWTESQARFVDEPDTAIDDAERLVDEAMKARGYPVGDDFDRRYDDLSVEYAHVLDNYRRARDVSVARNEGGDVTTEDLRTAMVCYRDLFTELLNTSEGPPAMRDSRRTA